MQSTGARPTFVVTGGARGGVGHAGTRLLADLADKAGVPLAAGPNKALTISRKAGYRRRSRCHDIERHQSHR